MFIAREKELKLLDEIMSKPTGSVMIYGKRKVGKTTLITHALENSKDATIYYGSVRSGQVMTFEKSVVIMGDIKAGGTVVSGRRELRAFHDLAL